MNWIQDVTRFIFVCDPPKRSDLIFVPGNTFPEPSRWAARLYLEGLAPRILVSGRYSITTDAFYGGENAREYPSEAAFMQHILLEQGVPDADILVEDQAQYTYQNALFSRKLLESRGLLPERAMLVCLPWHARRCSAYFETVFPEVALSVCPVPGTRITRDNWMESQEGISLVMGELRRCAEQFHTILPKNPVQPEP